MIDFSFKVESARADFLFTKKDADHQTKEAGDYQGTGRQAGPPEGGGVCRFFRPESQGFDGSQKQTAPKRRGVQGGQKNLDEFGVETKRH